MGAKNEQLQFGEKNKILGISPDKITAIFEGFFHQQKTFQLVKRLQLNWKGWNVFHIFQTRLIIHEQSTKEISTKG